MRTKPEEIDALAHLIEGSPMVLIGNGNESDVAFRRR